MVFRDCRKCLGKGIVDIVPPISVPFSYTDERGDVHKSSYVGGKLGMCPYCRGTGEELYYTLTRGVSLPPIVERRK